MRTQHAIIKKERHFQLHDKHMKNIRIDSSKKRVVILYIYISMCHMQIYFEGRTKTRD
jgi:hypothetical protein